MLYFSKIQYTCLDLLQNFTVQTYKVHIHEVHSDLRLGV